MKDDALLIFIMKYLQKVNIRGNMFLYLTFNHISNVYTVFIFIGWINIENVISSRELQQRKLDADKIYEK